jgi:hypothetical protein
VKKPEDYYRIADYRAALADAASAWVLKEPEYLDLHAHEVIEKSRSLREAVATDFPMAPYYRAELAHWYIEHANLRLKSEDREGSKKAFQQALKYYMQFMQSLRMHGSSSLPIREHSVSNLVSEVGGWRGVGSRQSEVYVWSGLARQAHRFAYLEWSAEAESALRLAIAGLQLTCAGADEPNRENLTHGYLDLVFYLSEYTGQLIAAGRAKEAEPLLHEIQTALEKEQTALGGRGPQGTSALYDLQTQEMSVHLLLGQVYAACNRKQDEEKEYHLAETLTGESGSLSSYEVHIDKRLRFSGIAHYRVGRWEESIAAFKKVDKDVEGLHLHPHYFLSSLECFHLAMAHWRLGQKAKAHEYYQLGKSRMSGPITMDEIVREGALSPWIYRIQPQLIRNEARTLLGIEENP